MNTPSDLRDVHKTAVQTSADIVSAVTRGDLRRPTPCAGWTLGDLLTHMTVVAQKAATMQILPDGRF
ncbi:maleylpyruvate isomerase N-terminal domain-containing protein, partial [Mycobacteroides abscessus subsp. massiliense]|uniref:maleylpyruvate isomerase N-terminal domain-containing protein n=1 Tax=Mycobacteroides abscessus TaxID=36809 RepID=UPI003CE87793